MGVWVALHTLFLRGAFNGSGIARRNAGGQGAVERVRAGLAFLAKHLGLDIRVADLSPSPVVPVVNKEGSSSKKDLPTLKLLPSCRAIS